MLSANQRRVSGRAPVRNSAPRDHSSSLLTTMAASAADVRSILSIPEPAATTPGPSQLKKPAALSTRKPDGISRELYSLIGPSAPSLAAQLAKPRLKQKPNLGGGGKVKWWFLCSLRYYFTLTGSSRNVGSAVPSKMADARIR